MKPISSLPLADRFADKYKATGVHHTSGLGFRLELPDIHILEDLRLTHIHVFPNLTIEGPKQQADALLSLPSPARLKQTKKTIRRRSVCIRAGHWALPL
jgi:hypothetical protein